MLGKKPPGVVVVVGSVMVLILTWLVWSAICLACTSLLLIADPGMTISEMIRIAMVGGAIATAVGLVSEYLKGRSSHA